MPRKLLSEAERPVMLCVRVPRALYEQVQAQMDRRRMSLTEAALDALRLWVETPADPREALASDNSNTLALQQLAERVGARLDALEATLATLRFEAAVATANIPSNNSMTTVIQKSEAARSATTEQSEVLLGDTRKVKLGRLCPRGHDYNGTGKSLRRATRGGDCVECGKEQKRAKRQAAKVAREDS